MMKVNLLRSMLFVLFAGLLSCQQEIHSEKLVLEGVPLEAEGPLFEGSTTFQGQKRIDLGAILKEKGIENKQLRDISFQSASLQLPGGMIRSLTLSMAGERAKMFEAGIVNPVPEGQDSVSVQMGARTPALIDYFREATLTFVVDADLVRDTAESLTIYGTFVFDLKIAQ